MINTIKHLGSRLACAACGWKAKEGVCKCAHINKQLIVGAHYLHMMFFMGLSRGAHAGAGTQELCGRILKRKHVVPYCTNNNNNNNNTVSLSECIEYIVILLLFVVICWYK